MSDLSGYVLEELREDDEIVLYRGTAAREPPSILVAAPRSAEPGDELVRRLEHEASLAGELGPDWAAVPLAIAEHRGRTALVLADPGGLPLDIQPGWPLDSGYVLDVAIGLAAALGRAHAGALFTAT